MASAAAAVVAGAPALLVLLTALGFGVFLDRTTVLLWSVRGGCLPGRGFSLIDLEEHVPRDIWNGLFLVGGIAVGVLVFLSVLLAERFLSEAASSSRCKSPLALTLPGVAGITALAALTAMTSLAVFAIHPATLRIAAPLPSVLTQDLRQDPYATQRLLPQVPSTSLAPVLYHSAYLSTLAALDPLNPPISDLRRDEYGIDASPPLVGQTRFPDMASVAYGVGVSVASLVSTRPFAGMAHYGAGAGFLPVSIRGTTVGTHVRVQCSDTTKDWTWNQTTLSAHANSPLPSSHPASPSSPSTVYVFHLTAPSAQGRAPRAATVLHRSGDPLALRTWLDADDGAGMAADGQPPRQVFAFLSAVRLPSFPDRPIFGIRVFECAYRADDVRRAVHVAPPDPLSRDRAGSVTFPSPDDSRVLATVPWERLYPAARAVSLLLGRDGHGEPDERRYSHGDVPLHSGGGDGGVLWQAAQHAGLLEALRDGAKTYGLDLDLGKLLETVLAQTAGGYFSLFRQRVEAWGTRDMAPVAGADELKARVVRIGGRGWGWCAVVALLAGAVGAELGRVAVVATKQQLERRRLRTVREAVSWLPFGDVGYGDEGDAETDRLVLPVFPPIVPPKNDEIPPSYDAALSAGVRELSQPG